MGEDMNMIAIGSDSNRQKLHFTLPKHFDDFKYLQNVSENFQRVGNSCQEIHNFQKCGCTRVSTPLEVRWNCRQKLKEQ